MFSLKFIYLSPNISLLMFEEQFVNYLLCAFPLQGYSKSNKSCGFA